LYGMKGAMHNMRQQPTTAVVHTEDMSDALGEYLLEMIQVPCSAQARRSTWPSGSLMEIHRHANN
jgi:hypothetical protein